MVGPAGEGGVLAVRERLVPVPPADRLPPLLHGVASGFLGLEDNEAMKFVQEGVRRASTDVNVLKLESGKQGTSNTLISEAAIRSMYSYYRGVMGF